MTDPFSPLSIRVRRLLASHNITTVEQVTDRYPLRLLGIRGFGSKALREVEIAFLPRQQYLGDGGNWPMYCRCPLCWRE